MKVLVNIGHGGNGSNYDSGAIGAYGVEEHKFNRDELYPLLKKELELKGFEVIQVIQDTNFLELPRRINALKPDLIISLHFNSFNGVASGTEMLYWHNSTRGKALAEKLQANVVGVLGLPNRGIKGLATGRGSALLRLTNAPCVILEPFFGDNKKDLDTARSRIKELAKAISDSI